MAADIVRSGTDAVVFPAEDGGYVLIGMRKPAPALFETMPWGSGTVLKETKARAAKLGLRTLDIATLWDVDQPDDVDRLEREFPELAL